MSKVTVVDTSLRDGSHSVRHQFSPDEVAKIAKGLEESGVDIIEIGHGDGLTGSTINYGFAKASDYDLVKAASDVLTKSKIAVLLIPGIGTVEDLEEMRTAGCSVVRVATHVTEADISAQHIKASKDMGFYTVGFLMMSHMAGADRVVEEALKMESYGADTIYVTDSGGAMLNRDVREKIGRVKEAVKIPVGHHAHNNLGLAVSNSITAIEAGATFIDGSLGGLGAGSGNTPTELLSAVMKREGIENNTDLYKLLDTCDDILRPILDEKGVHLSIDHDSLMIGYAGVYSSFLLHARRASKRFNVDVRDILMELGRIGAIGGQEDLIISVANDLSKKKK
ncbi:MAG: 4-hydroxy-2-oxovalerate aldolase [Chloroflexi bacterium]|nr:4-hydroxy-2-oxovalerate aldolase [Chloroflexota bacterium]